MQGNLLDDTELITVLANTKQTAEDVNERLAGASATNLKLTEACEEFRPVALRAALLYFLIAEFSVINCMYQAGPRAPQCHDSEARSGLCFRVVRVCSPYRSILTQGLAPLRCKPGLMAPRGLDKMAFSIGREHWAD